MEVLVTTCAIVIGYLIGAIPVGVVVCRAKGLDPRRVGSGRTGATNVYRTAGWPAAVLTGVGDVAKGFVPVVLAMWLAGQMGVDPSWSAVAAGLAATFGHVYPVYSNFRGGAGTSPNLGAALALDPVAFAITLAVLLVVLFGVRIASLASLSASAAILLIVGGRVVAGVLPPAYMVYALLQLALVVWALRPNIARLRAGTERRVAFRWRRAAGEP